MNKPATRRTSYFDRLGPAAREQIARTSKLPQAEMVGMETDAAAVLMVSMKRAADRKREKKGSKEEEFAFQLRSYQLPVFERQLMFAAAIGRRWKFDFANRSLMLAIEIEGLDVHVVPNPQRKSGREFIVGGRHTSVDGIQEDMVKYNTATLLGWSLLRFSQRMVKSGEAIEMTQRVLAAKGWTR